MTSRTAFRAVPLLGLLAFAAGCAGDDDEAARVETAAVERRTITIDAQATGVIEPINVVEVKSKASGIITQMSVETGMQVRPGELLAQIDTRDVRNQYNQAQADLEAAQARLQVASAQKRRTDEMFAARVITAQEHETSALDYANAQAQLVRARASLDLAQQRLEDATVSAPVAGTIIERTVSLGQVITSATGSNGAGTTLLKMADLDRVRVRALFNETDIGTVRSTQEATVVVDAYPDRRFAGLVEKIEPQAVVQQGVTMFPVLVTLDNREGLLKPGMNGEVSVLIEQRDNVLAVPNDAVRNPREAMAVAPMLGLDPDSVQAQLAAQMGGGRGGARQATTSGGDVALQQGRAQEGQGRQQVQVTDAQCAEVTAAFAKKPAEKKKLDDLTAQMRSGALDFQAARGQMQAIYAAVGVDGRIAMACRRRDAGGQAQGAGSGRQRGGAARSGADAQSAPGASGGGAAPRLQTPGELGAAPRARGRTGLVFVLEGGAYKPRVVRLGAGNFDYTEVTSGLREGEQVALLAALSLQAQRAQQQDQIRSRMGGGVPGMQQQGGGARGGAGGGGGGGGGGGAGGAPRGGGR